MNLTGKKRRKLPPRYGKKMGLHTIFKYLPLKYAKLLVNSGSIKIGTLYSYRDIEELGNEIGDNNEGSAFEYSHDKEPKRGDRLNPLERTAIKVGSGMVVANNYIERRHNSPNYYIFCASLSNESSIIDNLNRDYPKDKYDACVEITNLKNFISNVSTAFSSKAQFVDCFQCVYIKRKYHYTKSVPHPALIKDPRYSYQNEVRLIWEPKDKLKQIEPEYFTIKSIKTNCRFCM